jgi:hypothetical protein
MWKCPKCNNIYREGIGECPNDGILWKDVYLHEITKVLRDATIMSLEIEHVYNSNRKRMIVEYFDKED